jgi:protein associated with RNAse G/E
MLLAADVYKMLVNGAQWGGWRGYQLPVSDNYVCIWTPIGTPMYWKPGTWISQKHTLAYFWHEAWYVIQVSYDESGGFVSGYCDVTLPLPAYTNTSRELVYTDLYIDVVIREDGSVYTKDQEVFDRAAKRYLIVEQSRQKSFEVLYWLEEQARHWTGPFAVMPRHLPCTDWMGMSTQEIRDAMRGALP